MVTLESPSTKTTSGGDRHTSTLSADTSRRNTHTTSTNTRDPAASSAIKGAPIAETSTRASFLENGHTGQTMATSSPLRAGQIAKPTAAVSQPTALSAGAEKAVIAASTIGGTLILALLIYFIWRRRRGATYSELICFRRHSDTITLATTRDERLTALPIYREERYSVHSSRLGSTLTLNKNRKRPSGVPAAVAERFHKDNPWVQTVWKSQNPPTPTNECHPLTQVASGPPSPSLKQLGMVRVCSSHAEKGETSKNSSQDTTKSGGVTIQETMEEASPTGTMFGYPPETPRSPNEDRWSWTNSQAPPTPRMAARSHRSSLSSLPKYRRVRSWVRGQAHRHGVRITEEPLPSSRRVSAPVLKNKASKPNLAPKAPTRKLSKKRRPQSSTHALRPSIDGTGTSPPLPAKLPDSRPQTAPQPTGEDDLFISYS